MTQRLELPTNGEGKDLNLQTALRLFTILFLVTSHNTLPIPNILFSL